VSSGYLKAAAEDAKRKPGRPPGPGSTTRRNVLAAQKMFQEYAQEALDTMVAIMRDPDADHAVRLKASNDVLARAYGTPVSVSVQHQIQERENVSPVDPLRIGNAATEDLQLLAQTLTKYLSESSNADVIDVTPTMPPEYPDN
jgi:hypothetical protein